MKTTQEEKRQNGLISIMNHGEDLSKHGKINESQKVLLPLTTESFEQPARLYKRLAINARKQKDYMAEIEFINKFITDFQPLYGGTMWLDVFEPRLAKAKELYKKSLK